ncbi:T9SS type A sorting domain-containing protein [candidate division WOR-3 bacterium]|nr:T9SS type A sorting domain-containing protein [candidate division WOR-3 bacterium]
MKKYLLLVALSLFVFIKAQAWQKNGVVICNATDHQYSPTIAPDGSGGAIIAWKDLRSDTSDIYAQRIDSSGVARWTPNGIVICNADSSQDLTRVASDGSGGAIITWRDYRNGNWDIYAQRIDSSGVTQWTTNGVVICDAPSNQMYPRTVSDGSYGAIIAWKDLRSGNADIYVQRVDASGTVKWTPNGVVICDAPGGKEWHTITSNGSGGAIIAWEDYRSGDTSNIYVQRVDASGVVQWDSNGVVICDAPGNQFLYASKVISDGSGGAITTWTDGRSDVGDIYVQRIDSEGVVQWSSNGVVVCDATDEQWYSRIMSDGSGGYIIAWYDWRNGAWGDIYAQRIDSEGVVQWTPNGVWIGDVTGNMYCFGIVSDGSGSAIIAYETWASGDTSDIYAQRVDSEGVVQWTPNGVVICDATDEQWVPRVISDGSGGAIITWQDERSGNWDIYAQRVDSTGSCGEAPDIAISDTLHDFGEVIIDSSKDWILEIMNEGNSDLIVDSIISTEPQFTVLSTKSDTIAPDDSLPYTIRFSPSEEGAIEGTLFVYSNDPDEAIVSVLLKGNGITGVEEIDSKVPSTFFVMQNFPNPFVGRTAIKYAIPRKVKVSLEIYDISGSLVKMLINEKKEPGCYTITWDAKEFLSGIYFVKFSAGDYTSTKKLILMK